MKNLCLRYLILALCCFLSFACSSNQVHSPSSPPSSAGSTEHTGHHHEHTAPHGGTLVVLGEEFGHLELLLNKETGELTAYILDGEAEKPIRLPGTPLAIQIDGKESLTLNPVADELTGETEADSATYRGTAEALKNRNSFDGILSKIEMKGQAFENVTFKFPKGNEDGDERHHE